MFKKIVYLVVLIILSLCVIEPVRIYILNNWFYPSMSIIARDKQDYMLYLKCGQIKIMTKEYDEAINNFKAILKNASTSDHKHEKLLAYYYLGNAFYLKEDYDNALKAYVVVLKNDPGNKKALKKFSRIKMAKGDYVSLYPFVNAYIKEKPKDSFGHCERCALLTRLGKFSHARKSCEEAISIRKGYARAHYDLAVLYEKQGFKELAEKEYTLARKNQPRIKSREELEALLNIDESFEEEN